MMVEATNSLRNIIEQIPLRAYDRSILQIADTYVIDALAFWTLLRWERKVALFVLQSLGVDLQRLAADVDVTGLFDVVVLAEL